LSGEQEGSGTIFFTHCNLSCVFCQNYRISQLGNGAIATEAEFIAMCLALRDQGALNINLVSPTPYTRLLAATLPKVKQQLQIPIIWNSNAYEKAETLKLLEGLVDVWLPDLKYFSDDLANKYSLAPHYFEYATQAIREMRRQQPKDRFDDDEHIQHGLMILHLMLPGCTEDTLKLLGWINDNLGNQTRVNLMAQYYPVYRADKHAEINRKLTKEEYQRGVDFLIAHEFGHALIQDLSSADERYTPAW
jgi:putative pyruvate formate lyase activating enzyme